MQHVATLAAAHPPGPTLVAVGMFDGVHRGHQHLVQRLVSEARAQGYTPVVLTFFPHPDLVLGRASGRYYLTSPEQRAALLGALGVTIVVTHPFDEAVRQVRAAAFVDQLLEYLQMRALWVGPEFALGYKREGNVAFLRAQGAQKGFAVEVVNLVTSDENGGTISSSAIRAALQEGAIERVTHALGRPYRLEGIVVHGNARGRTIGFPTANIAVWAEQLLPANGVYAGWAHLGAETFRAVANVGHRPTFDGGLVTVEAHLLDFDRDIYGQHLIFDVLARLRAEQKFSSIEALIAQIHQDVIAARAVLEPLTPPRPRP